MKVVIADDEIKVCKLIACLVDWDALGLEIVSVVHDGTAALDAVRQFKPDILITDIRMPELDGLELIKQSIRAQPELSFIIISGYSQFDYAQKAIKYGVEDYILKPIRRKELTYSLEKIIDKHNNLKLIEDEKASMMDRIHTDGQRLKINFLNMLIDSDKSEFPVLNMSEINGHYHCRFTDSCIQVYLFQLIIGGGERDLQTLSYLAERIREQLLTAPNNFDEMIVTVREDFVYCLVNGPEEECRLFVHVLKNIRGQIHHMQDVFRNIKLYIFCSSIHSRPDEICLCLGEVRTALHDKLTNFSSVISFKKPDGSFPIADYLTVAVRKQFLIAVETLDGGMIKKIITEIRKNLQTPAVNGSDIHDIFVELTSLFAYGVRTYNLEIDFLSLTQDLENNFLYFTDLKDLMDDLADRFEYALEKLKLDRRQELSKPVRTAKQYIHSHYSEPLTLETLGAVIGLNPSYFSSLFKKETGYSFVDYLTDVRIENAKDLLLENNAVLCDISEKVGFNDMKYFTKKFKKATGLSPTDYRKLYS